MQLYKVLDKNSCSPFRKFKFEVGVEYICEDFDGDCTIDCSRGFYAVDIDGLLYSWRSHCEVWRCEVGGKRVEFNQFKRRYEKIKLIEKVEPSEVKQLALAIEPKVGYRLSEVLFPINPLLIDRAKVPSPFELEVVKKWAAVAAVSDAVGITVMAVAGSAVGVTVRDMVRNTVGEAVGSAVRAKVRVAVRIRAGAAVMDTAEEAVWAYIGSLFPGITKWKYFQPAVDLWRVGLVTSYDGRMCRLHAGEHAEIIWQEVCNHEPQH